MGRLASGGDESSMSGGIEQPLGRRCWRGSGYLVSDLWGTQVTRGAGIHLKMGIGGWAWEGLEAMNTSFHSLPTVSPERYNYGNSSSCSKRTEGSCHRRRQSSSSSDAQQGQWETGESSWVGMSGVLFLVLKPDEPPQS